MVTGLTGRVEPGRRLSPRLDLVRDRRPRRVSADGRRDRGRGQRVHVLPELGEGLICYAHAPRVSAACQTVARQSDAPGVSRANDGLYPNGFYRLMSVLATMNVDRSVVVMRMASWVVARSLFLAAGHVARRAARPALALAALTTSCHSACTCSVHRSERDRIRRHRGVLGGRDDRPRGGGSTARRATVVAVLLVSAALALVSRSDAGLYLAVASLAAWLSAGGYRPPFARQPCLAAAPGRRDRLDRSAVRTSAGRATSTSSRGRHGPRCCSRVSSSPAPGARLDRNWTSSAGSTRPCRAQF